MTFWIVAYQSGWATIDQLKLAVSKGKLSAVDYQTITGEPYTA